MVRSGLVSATSFQLHNTSSEIGNETVGALFVFVERPTHLSADNFDAVGSGLLYRTNTRLGVGDLKQTSCSASGYRFIVRIVS